MLHMLDTFSGVGMISLAAEWTGRIKTVGFCEIDPYCRKVLQQHWPGVPIFGDIRKLTRKELICAGIDRVDIMAGGFPCQPYSKAGLQKGEEDERHLWPELRRLADEVRPTWLVGENVENAVRMVLDNILDDLEGINYKAQSFVVSAYCAGARFDGKRTFIVASSNDRSAPLRRNAQFQSNAKTDARGGYNRRRAPELNPGERWKIESRPYGVANGVPDRVDRNNAIGNAVNPYQIYPILKAIADIEDGGA